MARLGLVACLLLCLVASIACVPFVGYYVDPAGGQSNNSGRTPANAFRTISQAMAASDAASEPSVQIYLAGGFYNGTENVGLTFSKPTRLGRFWTDDYDDATIQCQGDLQTGLYTTDDFNILGIQDTFIVFSGCHVGVNATGGHKVAIKKASFSKCQIGIYAQDVYSFTATRLYIYAQDETPMAVIAKSSVQDPYTSARVIGCYLESSGISLEGYAELDLFLLDIRDVSADSGHPAIELKNSGRTKANYLTMINCHSHGDGGAILLENVGFQLNYGQFVQCSAGGNGGAIYTNSFIEMDSTRFYNCSAGGSGGGLYAKTPYSTECNLVLTHFASCSAPNGAGGGAFFDGGYYKVTAGGSTFTNNTASVGGGFACCTESSDCSVGKVVLSQYDYFVNNSPNNYTCGVVRIVQ